MEATLTILKEWGVKRIKVMSLIATTSGAYPRPPWTLHVHTHAALARVFILFCGRLHVCSGDLGVARSAGCLECTKYLHS